MTVIVLILLIPIVVYGLRIMIGEQSSQTRRAKTIRLIFIIFICFYFILLISEKYNYYLRGYRSTSFVFLAATLGGILYCLSDRRPILTSFPRIILNLIVVLFMAGSGFLLIELFDDYGKQLFYSDKRFRLEATGRGVMAQCGLPVLFIKEGIIERKSLPLDFDAVPCLSKDDLYDIRIHYQDSFYVVNYYFVRDRNLNDSVPHKVQYRTLNCIQQAVLCI
jgi:hypothetical protein